MAFIPIPDGVKAAVTMTIGSINYANVYHFIKENFTQSDMIALALALWQVYDDYLMPYIGAQISLTKVTVTDERTQGAQEYVLTQAAVAGAKTGELFPLGDAAVITHRTNKRGRSYRGRTFISGFVETQCTGNLLTDAPTIAAMESFSDYVRTIPAAIGWSFVIASKQINGTVRTSADTELVVSSDMRNATLGSQRKRKRRS